MDDVAAEIQFVLNAEAGILEKQTVLACESLRRFGGALSKARITVVSPRPSRRPSPESVARLERLEAEYLPLDLKSPYPQSDVSYKPLALAHVESRCGPPLIVQMDSDTLVLHEPSALVIDGDAGARPVDGRSLSTTGSGDPADPFWRNVCTLIGADYEALPVVTATVSRLRLKANYNGGLIVARREACLFQRTAEVIETIVAANAFPLGAERRMITAGSHVVEGAAARYFGIDQVGFSLACACADVGVELLPETYNFPLHMLDDIVGPIRSPIAHVHYHAIGSRPYNPSHPLASPRLKLTADRADWLQRRLPL